MTDAPAAGRLPHGEIERCRVLAWLEATDATPIRVLAAPVGTGKTLAVRQFAQRSGGRVRYERVTPGADRAALDRLIAHASGGNAVILDGIDRADSRALSDVLDDIVHGLIAPRLILVGRSRRRLQTHLLLARGIANAYLAADLAFDAGEITQLAAAYDVACDEHDLAQVLSDTEGWPLAAHWLVRDAAQNGRPLTDAFTCWREANGHLLLEFVENERQEDADAFAAFARVLTAGGDVDRFELDRLEQIGLPLVRTRNGVRPYRILLRLAEREAPSASVRQVREGPRLMMLGVLGKFRCEIAGRPVVFARRRDAHVFVFVALSPEGRATRQSVLDAFWPGADRRVAAQGLRITLSRIRRSIGLAAPGVEAQDYFDTSGDVSLDLTVIAVDARRFVDHVEQGRLEDAIGAVEGAKHHYRSACRIYADRLLAMETPEPCFERAAEELQRHYLFALTRMTELHAALGELDAARGYARDLIACNSEDARRHALGAIAGSRSVPA